MRAERGKECEERGKEMIVPVAARMLLCAHSPCPSRLKNSNENRNRSKAETAIQTGANKIEKTK